MPSVVLEGEPVPRDGALPPAALAAVGQRPLAFYVHVPFCAVRCGYCDFNTYTAAELGPPGLSGAGRDTYADAAIAEVRRARRVLGDADVPVSTVFVGGGTPTLLAAADLVRVVAAIRTEFGLAADAEISTEANPDSVTPAALETLSAGGFTRVSYGMQSAVPHVLATLERTHDPARVAPAVAWAREAGIGQVSLDLIYGTPGERVDDWRRSLDAATALAPDHVSAYALIVEDGTKLAAQVRRGDVAMPDDDDLADKYVMADEALAVAGFGWYEVSNWATSPGARCRHNLAYWRSDDWWGIGPGAHSHVAGVRWWNVKHPAAYAGRIAEDASPAHAREVLGAADRRVERILLGIRLAEGHPLDDLPPGGRIAAARLVTDGLLEPAAHADGRAVLTLRGRLLADAVVRELT